MEQRPASNVDSKTDPGIADIRSVTAAMPAADAFLCLASSIIEEIGQYVQSLDSAADPETLHKLRVSLRRLRSLCWAYQPLLARKNTVRQQALFKSLADMAGRTRNWDVLYDLLETNRHASLELTSLSHSISQCRADALSDSLREIRRAGVAESLRQSLSGASEQLARRDAGPQFGDFAGLRVAVARKRLKKQVRWALRDRHAGYAGLHAVRIAGKKLRYLTELFASAPEVRDKGSIKRLVRMQDELGRLNDLAVSESLLRQHAEQLANSEEVEKVIRWLRKRKRHAMRSVLGHFLTVKAGWRGRKPAFTVTKWSWGCFGKSDSAKGRPGRSFPG